MLGPLPTYSPKAHAKLPPRSKTAVKASASAKKRHPLSPPREYKAPKRTSSRRQEEVEDDAPFVPIPVGTVPLDTWTQVFGWFIDRECRLLRRVCKQWSDLIGARALTQRTHEDDDRISLHMPWSCHALRRPFPWKDSLYAGQVETLNMVCTDYGSSQEAYFEETFPNLSRFHNLKNLAVSSSASALVEINNANLSRLETLTISAPHSLLPGVEKFTFGVQRLQLFGFSDLITQDVREMLTAFPSVRHLSFKGSSWETPASAISWISETIGTQLESLAMTFDRDNYEPKKSIKLADILPLVALPQLRALSLTLNPPHEPETLPFGILENPFSHADSAPVGSLSAASSTVNNASSTSNPTPSQTTTSPLGILTFASHTIESLSLRCLEGSKEPIRLEMPRLGSLILDSILYVDVSACSFLEQLKMWTLPPFASSFFEHAPVANLREVALIRSPTKLATRHLALPLNLELPQVTKLTLNDFSLRDLPSEISINTPLLKTLKMIFHLSDDLGPTEEERVIPITLQTPIITEVAVEANPQMLAVIYNQLAKIPSIRSMELVRCKQWRADAAAPSMDVDEPSRLPFPQLSSLILGSAQPPLARLGHLAALNTLKVDAEMKLTELEAILRTDQMPSLRVCDILIRSHEKVSHRSLNVSLPSLQTFRISMSYLPSVNFVVEHPHLTDLSIIGPPSSSWWRRTARSIQKLDWLKTKVPNLQRLHLMQVKLATTLVIIAPKLISLSMTGVTSHNNMKLTLKARRLRHLIVQDQVTQFETINADLPSLSLIRTSKDMKRKDRDEFTKNVKDKSRLIIVSHGDNRKGGYTSLLRPFARLHDPASNGSEGGPEDPIDVDSDSEQKQKYQEVEAQVAAANLPPEVGEYFGNAGNDANLNMPHINIALPLLGRLFAQHNMLFNPIADLQMIGRALNLGGHGGYAEEEDMEEGEGEPYYCHNCHRMHVRRRYPYVSDDEDSDDDSFDEDMEEHVAYPFDVRRYYSGDEDTSASDDEDGDLARLYGAYLGAYPQYSDNSDEEDDEE